MGQRWNGQERNDGRLAFDETLLQCPQRILELSETVGRETAAQKPSIPASWLTLNVKPSPCSRVIPRHSIVEVFNL